jgi:hypothetical protein
MTFRPAACHPVNPDEYVSVAESLVQEVTL